MSSSLLEKKSIAERVRIGMEVKLVSNGKIAHTKYYRNQYPMMA